MHFYPQGRFPASSVGSRTCDASADLALFAGQWIEACIDHDRESALSLALDCHRLPLV
jgi:hypothetical protein